ncbi:hypothetical protein FB45DRAFT_868801 [Roridomyces roridus]|uniref:BTB domain-containing protein n=1 Tax=Roridomyces roridus TaxID=1738132 RepID=A0AAD7BMT9_9AGAR|nr:hypothetical protein FB45DRAFT_868801 [Roridomyces roridus]
MCDHVEEITFKVEDRIFKAPRHLFERNSEIFATVFTLPEVDKEGCSAENPFVLEGVQSADFEQLVQVLRSIDTAKSPGLPKESWISVLKLSTLWYFIDARNLAIQELGKQTMDSVERILLARRYDVSVWLRRGYAELARRPRGLSVEEAEAIGLMTALKLYQSREAALRSHYAGYESPGLGYMAPSFHRADVDVMFKEEFRLADLASATYV